MNISGVFKLVFVKMKTVVSIRIRQLDPYFPISNYRLKGYH
jgi:hypothetical protein